MRILSCKSRRFQNLWPLSLALVVGLSLGNPAHAQSCLTAADMDEGARSSLLNTGKRFFDMAARGDSAGLRQNSMANLAADFSGIETAVRDNQAAFSGVQAVPRAPFLLKLESPASSERAEFLCGVFGKEGQTSNSAVFAIPNLPPGSYAIVILDVPAVSGAMTASFVLQQQGNQWKLGGFYVKPAQAKGHDGNWYAQQGREFKAKNQTLNAWLYLLEARDLLVPVPFMSTMMSDRLYDEMQTVHPAELPPSVLSAPGKTFKLTSLFPLIVGKDFDLVVKFQATDVSNTSATYQDNMAVMKALLAKYPELRGAFDGIVARAVEPSGRDYGSLLAMKDVK